MSHTKRGSKGPGYEYWSRRPAKGCINPGKQNKIITHRLERAAAKRLTRRHEMGWCGGASIAESVWELVRKHIPKNKREKIAGEIVDIFESEDADTMYEAAQLMEDAGRDYEEDDEDEGEDEDDDDEDDEFSDRY